MDMNIVAAGEFDRDGEGFTPEGWKSPLRVTEGAPREATPRHARIEASIRGWDDDTVPIALHIQAIEPAD